MAKKSATIEDVKKAKIGLEKQILDLAKSFEKDYGVKVSYVHFNRKRDEDNMSAPVKESKPGPIVNVDVNMDLDLIY